MKLAICSFVLLFALPATAVVLAQTTTLDFNNDKVGEAPSGFSTALTGRGRPGKWVVMKGNHFEVYHNGKKLYEVEDETLKQAGKIGLWTKADSVIYFDDLTITVQ